MKKRDDEMKETEESRAFQEWVFEKTQEGHGIVSQKVAADMCNVTEQAIYSQVKRGKMECYQYGNKKFIPLKSIKNYLKKSQFKTREERSVEVIKELISKLDPKGHYFMNTSIDDDFFPDSEIKWNQTSENTLQPELPEDLTTKGFNEGMAILNRIKNIFSEDYCPEDAYDRHREFVDELKAYASYYLDKRFHTDMDYHEFEAHYQQITEEINGEKIEEWAKSYFKERKERTGPFEKA